VKEERRARFMAVQARISARRLATKVGRTLDVLVDRVEGDRAVARSSADAPEIDGIVSIDDGAALAVGSLARVRVTGSDAHDLRARIDGARQSLRAPAPGPGTPRR
jgi:ribosomal protein S12 methylthiotransferase